MYEKNKKTRTWRVSACSRKCSSCISTSSGRGPGGQAAMRVAGGAGAACVSAGSSTHARATCGGEVWGGCGRVEGGVLGSTCAPPVEMSVCGRGAGMARRGPGGLAAAHTVMNTLRPQTTPHSHPLRPQRPPHSHPLRPQRTPHSHPLWPQRTPHSHPLRPQTTPHLLEEDRVVALERNIDV